MNRYFEQQIIEADPVELTRLLYQRVVACIRDAREHLRNRRIAERTKAIERAYAALAELRNSLNHQSAPDLAGRLRDLYSYSQDRLIEANMQQTDAPLAEALNIMTTLAEAWTGVQARLAAPQEKVETLRSSWQPPRVLAPIEAAYALSA